MAVKCFYDSQFRVDDPKTYVKRFEAMKQNFKWNPKQVLDEQMCVPSEAEAYLKVIAGPTAEESK